MLNAIPRNVGSVIAAVVMSFWYASGAFAQTAAEVDPPNATSEKLQAKAVRKQARKTHRAAKNAELSKLEKNGFNPGTNDVNYPENLQAAQKKAGIQ